MIEFFKDQTCSTTFFCSVCWDSHLGHVVHEVHAGLVGLGVGQIEQRAHPEANSIGTVTTLNSNSQVITQ